jgi:hypothetical protein
MRRFLIAAFLAALSFQAAAQAQTPALTTPATSYRYAAGPITTFAVTPTDWVVINPSASKNVSVTKISVCGTASVPTTLDVLLIKRSTADTAGTSSLSVAVNISGTNVVATGGVTTYTANPTLGTFVGNIDAKKLNVGPSGTAGCLLFDYTTVLLRGSGQLAINLAGATMPGSTSLSYMVETFEQ